MALQAKTGGDMEVDAQVTEKCALNCEALDLALDEIIKSQSEKRATGTAGRNPQAKRPSGKGVRNGVVAKAKGRRMRQEGRSLLKPRLSVGDHMLKKRGVPRTTRGIGQVAANLKNIGRGRRQAGTNRVFVGEGESYVLVAQPNVVGRRPVARTTMKRRNIGAANPGGSSAQAMGNRDGPKSHFLKKSFQGDQQNRSFQRMGPQRPNLGVRPSAFKMRAASGRLGFKKPVAPRGTMASGGQLASQRPKFGNGLYEPPHRRSAGSGGGVKQSFNNYGPGVDFGWKKSGQGARLGGNRLFGNQGRRVAGAMGFGPKGRRGFRNSF